MNKRNITYQQYDCPDENMEHIRVIAIMYIEEI